MTHSRRKVQIDMVAFRRDVEEGTKQITLCEKYGISTATVARLKAEISGKLARREDVSEQALVEAFDGAFRIAIDIPAERLDSLLSGNDLSLEELRAACLALNDQAKAEIVQALLQGRVDRALEPQAVELPRLVAAQ